MRLLIQSGLRNLQERQAVDQEHLKPAAGGRGPQESSAQDLREGQALHQVAAAVGADLTAEAVVLDQEALLLVVLVAMVRQALAAALPMEEMQPLVLALGAEEVTRRLVPEALEL